MDMSYDQNLTINPVPATRPSVFFSLYLLLTIILVGLPGCCIGVPLILAGRFWRPLELFAGRYGCRAIRFMFDLNIWLRKDVRLDIPYAVGRSNVPTLFIANHRSHLDVFFLISRIPNLRIVAKQMLFLIPFLGPMMFVMRQIPFRRGHFSSYWRALSAVKAGLKKGDPVLMFAEGKRCSEGHRGTQAFQIAPFKLAFELGINITPIVFIGTDHVWPKGSLGIDPHHLVRVRTLPVIKSRQYAHAEALMQDVKRRMDAYLERHG